ncbi:MAG TPA: FkbM family methyltransferase [Puia sp.]|jgi:FkbM family methyltransferase
MNIVKKIRIKLNSLLNFYLFQWGGIPKVRKEEISKSVFKKYLPAEPVIVDCGAYDGYDTTQLAKILKGKIHAFEPIDDIFVRLKQNTAPYRNVSCYNLALSNNSGKQYFFVSEGQSDASSSFLEPKDHLLDHPDTVFTKRIEVEAVTLDKWAEQNNIGRVDMLWLDMQGFELAMLKASVNILNSVKLIHTEVSTRETYKGVPLYKEYREFLESRGFSVVIEAIPKGWDMGNVLFARI